MLDSGGLDPGVDAVETLLGHEERVMLRREFHSRFSELEEDATIETNDEKESAGLRLWETEDLGEEGG